MNDQFEKLGQEIDRIENLSCALQIPISPQIHLDQLKKTLPEVVENLKAAFVQLSGENPWE